MPDRVRVLIADDHPIFREGLRAALNSHDIEIVGEATDAPAVVELAGALQPDVILMDLHMPGGTGIDATRTIAAAYPAIAVLVLTMSEDSQAVLAAIRAGARGYLLKGADRDELRRGISAVAAGEAIFGPGIANDLLRALNQRAALEPLPMLTDREREVLALLVDGYTNTAIARRLVVNPKTVRNHVSNIITKLRVADRNEAARLGRDAGLGSQTC